MGLEMIGVIRKRLNMSIEELSEKSGVPLGTLSKISAGITKDPKLETVKAIARALSCRLDDFDDIPDIDTLPTSLESTLLNAFRQLNDEGQAKIVEYVEDLTASNRYKKGSKAANYDERGNIAG